MPLPPVYTYRAGRKVELDKRPDQFVVRALPEARDGIKAVERVSSGSWRVTTEASNLEQLMERARAVAPTHHAYYLAGTAHEFLITDRVLVTFRGDMALPDVDAFAAKYALTTLDRYSDREYLFQLTDHTAVNPVKLVVQLTENEPQVATAEHDLNRRVRTYAFSVPTDPSYARQWHLQPRLVDPQFDARSCARCEEAWQLLDGFGSPQVVVGITDDGCRMDHQDFDSPGKFAGWAYLEGSRLVRHTDIDADPAKMYEGGSNHGTSCAGVIGAETDAVLTVGAAPGCRLLPVKWQSDGPYLQVSDSKMLTVLGWIADKVDVLSNSWGNVPDNVWALNVVDRIRDLARTGGRRGRGIVFLWAAGNENCPIQHTGQIDVPYDDGTAVRPDGSVAWVGVKKSRVFENNLVGVPGVAHVAALASTAQRSHYSNYGPGMALCAPTSNGHEYHRITVGGLGITTTTGQGAGVTGTFGGTSSATPLVAGIAALAISANPALSAEEVLGLLKKTASRDLSVTGYARTPAASFDPDTSWDVSPIPPFDRGDFADQGSLDGTWSPWFGHGRVDARAAVAAARAAGVTAGQTVRAGSAPNRAIPDNQAAGVEDKILFTAAGQAQDVRVSVDIAHTWIGDLRVLLAGPDGTSVVLHDRAGADTDNIRKTYLSADTPGLATLRNRTITGDWTLRVQDLAAQDTGVLRSWTLELDVTSTPLAAEEAPGVRIPDDDPAGITRTLSLSPGQRIADVAISVDITHGWIGDLRVTLTPPGGPPIRLHDGAGGGSDNLVATWRSQQVPGLAALRGRDAGGAWTLQVVDTAPEDEGKLNRWGVEVFA